MKNTRKGRIMKEKEENGRKEGSGKGRKRKETRKEGNGRK